MKESLTKVINNLILPRYSEIVSFNIEIELWGDLYVTYVTYFTPLEIGAYRANELVVDTSSLFRMLGFPKEYILHVGLSKNF